MLKGPRSHIDPTPYRRPEPSAPDTIHLDGNEGNRPERELLSTLAEAGPELLRNYPSTRGLEERLAADLGVEARQVVVTAGADDALDRCCRAYLGPGREMILPVPGFEMLHRFAANAAGTVVSVPWMGAFPVDEVIGRIGAGTTLIAVVSPNNPTGAVIEPSDLERVAEAAHGSALVILDQVYKQYADADLTPQALALENVILVESLSKAPGLAGCRVGYAVARPEIADVLRSAGNPYPTSGMSLAVAAAALDRGRESMNRHVAAVRRERTELTGRLLALDVPVPESHGNFLLPDFGRRTRFVFEGLRALGVLVRWFPKREYLETRLRVTLPGDPADFARLVAGLELCLAPEALLFDLDSALAGEERSGLRRWAGRMPLGVVTGRPRAEAERLLETNGMSELMRVVVALEDGPAEPGPDPVRLALERLGVERAWLIGGTPEQMRAAGAAGALPVGLPAPGGEREATQQALLEAGAATLIEELDDLEELLP